MHNGLSYYLSANIYRVYSNTSRCGVICDQMYLSLWTPWISGYVNKLESQKGRTQKKEKEERRRKKKKSEKYPVTKNIHCDWRSILQQVHS
jgi:hypothetical protein